MPVIEVKITNDTDLNRFDIFHNDGAKSSGSDTNNNIWDRNYKIDTDKLSKYLNISIIISNKQNKSSTYISYNFKQCK